MATATKSQGKTNFVKDFLHDNPQANTKAVNEAWSAAGMTGTISRPMVSGVRRQLGLIGAQPGKTRTATKSASKMFKPVNPGKTMFVKEFLHDNPEGNVRAVNEAWSAAGMSGTISKTVVDKVRAFLGLTGNLRAKPKMGKKRGRPRTETSAAVNGKPAGQPRGNRSTVLNDMEADIDRLIFKAMGIGNLTEIEVSLRQARRLLYGALTGD